MDESDDVSHKSDSQKLLQSKSKELQIEDQNGIKNDDDDGLRSPALSKLDKNIKDMGTPSTI